MFRFLVGLGVGVALCLVLFLAITIFLTPSFIKSMALDDLGMWREMVGKAPAGPDEKLEVLARIDRMIERIHSRDVTFWEYTMATGDLVDIVEDKTISADEWARFAEEVRAAEVVLVGPPLSKPASPAGNPEAAPRPAPN